jgi:hypothetical protein
MDRRGLKVEMLLEKLMQAKDKQEALTITMSIEEWIVVLTAVRKANQLYAKLEELQSKFESALLSIATQSEDK